MDAEELQQASVDYERLLSLLQKHTQGTRAMVEFRLWPLD